MCPNAPVDQGNMGFLVYLEDRYMNSLVNKSVPDSKYTSNIESLTEFVKDRINKAVVHSLISSKSLQSLYVVCSTTAMELHRQQDVQGSLLTPLFHYCFVNEDCISNSSALSCSVAKGFGPLSTILKQLHVCSLTVSNSSFSPLYCCHHVQVQ